MCKLPIFIVPTTNHSTFCLLQILYGGLFYSNFFSNSHVCYLYYRTANQWQGYYYNFDRRYWYWALVKGGSKGCSEFCSIMSWGIFQESFRGILLSFLVILFNHIPYLNQYVDIKLDVYVIFLNDVQLWITAKIFMLNLQHYYDNTIFHRIIKGFMMQGGDPSGTGTGMTFLKEILLH